MQLNAPLDRAGGFSFQGWRLSTGQWFFLIALVAFILRALNLLFIPDETFLLFPDSKMYLELRDSFREAGAFVVQDSSGNFVTETERVPGYTLFLDWINTLFGSSAWPVVWVQSVIDSATAGLIFLLGRFAGPSIGILSGVLAAFWPNLIITSALVLNDTLFVFAVTLVLLSFAYFLRRPSLKMAAVAGLILGLSLMIRPVFQFLPPIVMAVVVIAAVKSGKRFWMAGLYGLVFLGAALLPPSPQLYRNITQFNTVSLTSQGGVHLMGWVLPMVIWHTEGISFEQATQEIHDQFDGYLTAKGLNRADLNAFAISNEEQQFALQALSDIPAHTLAEVWIKGAIVNLGAPAIFLDPRLKALRTKSLIESSVSQEAGWIARFTGLVENNSNTVTVVLLLGLIGSLVFSILQVLGIPVLWRRSPWGCIFALLIVAYILLLMGPVMGTKYRLPFAPVTVILSGCGIKFVWDKLQVLRGVRPHGPDSKG